MNDRDDSPTTDVKPTSDAAEGKKLTLDRTDVKNLKTVRTGLKTGLTCIFHPRG